MPQRYYLNCVGLVCKQGRPLPSSPGERKKLETLRDIMALIQRQINDLPVTFVALDLSNLPPVSFDNIDVCVLLSRMEHMKLEVAAISA